MSSLAWNRPFGIPSERAHRAHVRALTTEARTTTLYGDLMDAETCIRVEHDPDPLPGYPAGVWTVDEARLVPGTDRWEPTGRCSRRVSSQEDADRAVLELAGVLADEVMGW